MGECPITLNEWIEIEELPSIDEYWDVIKPCSREAPQFSFLTNIPDSIVDCIQDEGVYADFRNKHVYALDENGMIWEWHLLNNAYGLLGDLFVIMIAFGFVGLMIGIGVVFMVL